MKLAEFFIDLVVNAAGGEMTVNNLVTSVGELEVVGLGGIGMLTTFAKQLASLTDEAMNTAVSFKMFETQTGLSSMKLQKWQLIAEQANVSADAVRGSVLALERGMAEISLGRGNVSPYQLLGINPSGKTAFQVLLELRDALKQVHSQAMKVNLLQQMGIDPSMLQLLELSNHQLLELSKTSTGMTQEQETNFLSLKLAVVQFGQVLKTAGFATANFFSPAIKAGLSDVKVIFDLIGKGVTFTREEFEKYPGAMKVIMAGLAILAAAFFPVLAAVTAVIFALHELVEYVKGNKNIFSWLEQKTAEGGKTLANAATGSALGSMGLNPQFAGALMNSTLGQKLIQAPIYNTFHLTGNEYSAKKIVDTVMSLLQNQVNHADTLLNNGPKK